jgi:Ca2+-binding RTX toxin-like protein
MVLRYRTVDGSADAGADYGATSGRIQLAEGQTVASVVVPIRSDARLERAEDFSLVVTAPGSVAAVSRGEARILDGSITGDAGANNLRGTAAADAIFGLGGNDTLRGLGGNDALDGGAGNDRLFGDAGADRLLGGNGNDSLGGGSGNDRLSGGGGRDQLSGGTGGDTLAGGGAGDRFVFLRVVESAGRSRDTIADFDRGADRIVLSAIDADAGRRGNQSFDFIGGGRFDDEAGQLRYARGTLQGDVDGDGRADLQVEIAGVARLGNADFVL